MKKVIKKILLTILVIFLLLTILPIAYFFIYGFFLGGDISEEKVNFLLKERGLQAYNIDIMVISETPKLKPHIDMMKANLQSILEIPLDRISIKATTNEMLGAIGRREGIAAQAVVSVYEGEI